DDGRGLGRGVARPPPRAGHEADRRADPGGPFMNFQVLLATIVIALGGFGTWLLLPHRLGRVKPRRTHGFGAILAILALILLSAFYSPPGPFLQGAFFSIFATTAVGGGILTITSRNPIYSALWFASVVLSTSGLFL